MKDTVEIPPGWNRARPEKIPDPSWAPPGLALGSGLLVWGLISSWIIGAAGVGLFIVSLARWIGDIRHERKS